jgi:hypothetical protein
MEARDSIPVVWFIWMSFFRLNGQVVYVRAGMVIYYR